jgi:hypothetical protein
MNNVAKYEMCVKVAKTMIEYAQLQKANGSEGWRQSLAEGKRMANMAVSIKRELDADKTVELQLVA